VPLPVATGAGVGAEPVAPPDGLEGVAALLV
jgi:hypothetical protein